MSNLTALKSIFTVIVYPYSPHIHFLMLELGACLCLTGDTDSGADCSASPSSAPLYSVPVVVSSWSIFNGFSAHILTWHVAQFVLQVW